MYKGWDCHSGSCPVLVPLSSSSSFCRPLSPSPQQTWTTPSWRPSSRPRPGGRAAVGWPPNRPPPSLASGRATEPEWGRACWLRAAGSRASGASPGGWTSRPEPAGATQPTAARSPWWSWSWAEPDRWDRSAVSSDAHTLSYFMLISSPYLTRSVALKFLCRTK